ncbi:hypothetical protein WJX81_003718 [Elliptochloris bilobata]|uniref:Purple acid phosphatase n=1 Tax=Elliptochloris bilobata TaxID=381761 RepID=A0AAW1R9T8_9CHLO
MCLCETYRARIHQQSFCKSAAPLSQTILEQFKARGLVRNEEAAKALAAELGAPAGALHAGDIVADSSSAYVEAFKGAAALVIATSGVPVVIGPPGPDGRPVFGFKAGQAPREVDWEGQRRQMDTAFECGVQHVVLVSSMGICDAENRLNKIGDGNILVWKRRAERYLISRGFHSYTIIHPGGLLDAPGGERELVLGVDDQLLAASPRSIPRADVAELCVQALLLPEARNRSIDVISKEPGSGQPTSDFAALLRGMDKNASYEPFMPIADDPFKFITFEGPLAGQDPLAANSYSPTDPQQVHLGIAGPNAYYVLWATGYNITSTGTPGVDYPAPNPALVKTRVRFGLSAAALTTEFYNQIYNSTYRAFLQGTNPPPENYSSPVLSSAVIPVSANTQYYYQVTDANGVYTGPVYSFWSAPGAATFPQRVLVIADLGMSYNSSTTMQHVQASATSLPGNSKSTYLLNIGDMSYADTINPDGTYPTLPANSTGPGTYYIFTAGEGLNSATYQPLWDAWLRFLSRSGLTSFPMAASPGNHEIEQQADSAYTTFASYSARLKNPHRASSSSSFHYYSFNFGSVHNIMLSPYVDYTIGSPQYNWLVNDLKAIDRTLTPFVVAGVHNPWVSTDTSYKEFEQMRVSMEPIIYQYGVDVMFNGHVHSYERSNPVYNYVNNPCGMVHITVGDGGNSEGLSGLNYYTRTTDHLYEDSSIVYPNNPALNTGGCPYRGLAYRPGYLKSLNPSADMWPYYNVSLTFQGDGNSTGANGAAVGLAFPCGYCWKSQPPWSAYRESSFGHGVLDVLNATTALWSWNRNQDAVSVAADKVYIVRPPASQCPNKYNGGAPAAFVATAPSLPEQTGVCNPVPPAPAPAPATSSPAPTPAPTPPVSTPAPTPPAATEHPFLHPGLGNIADRIASHFGGGVHAEEAADIDAAERQALDDGHHK